ncbi:DUF6461 domain-containing protein [Streptomyces sp. NRRL S-378]|uniref:DUF6461 domain-containing protein n=1 Tax=Streptomyces sp. NRRL S-378 TaxID=1463904 RepID=UPI0004C75297|nr:DUF6461 domain-containing protein [Streptomyces sp. NRRL S-378]
MDGIHWLPEDCDAYCLLLVRGIDVNELVARLGHDGQAMIASMTSGEAFEYSMDKTPVARLGTTGDWAFSLEQWSAEGMEARNALRVSAGTECIAVLNSGMPPVWFMHAVDGEIVAFFEPSDAQEVVDESGPLTYASGLVAAGLVEAGVPEGVAEENSEVLLLKLMERHFGVDLPRSSILSASLPAISFPSR